MEENNEAPEISGGRQENEVGNSVTVALEKGGNEQCNSVDVTVAGVPDVCRVLSPNRWPQQETMDLIRIRSEMDGEFKGTCLKYHLWEDVSRKMAALGYHRSAMKCKEKFDNIYKYHKRHKSTYSARSPGKSYRFSNELEVLDHHQISLQTAAGEQIETAVNDSANAAALVRSNPPCIPQMATPLPLNSESSPFTSSTSITSSSGSDSEGTRARKRKWADLFDKMMTAVLEKQEYLQNKFLETIDKCEHERLAREEAWKKQEVDITKRQHELIMQERATTAAKDAAVMAFLQKISEKGKFSGTSGQMVEKPGQEIRIECWKDENISEKGKFSGTPGQELSIVCRKDKNDGENNSSRWPKEEVEALIRIKIKMESEHLKLGPLWRDISMAMKNIGYDRGAKKCKEKWDNINKYYRRVKESNKQRRAVSKACPYFHLLDSFHNMKTNTLETSSENTDPLLRDGELLLNMMNGHSGHQQQHEQVVFQ